MAVRKYVYDGDAVLQETDGAGATLTEYTRTGGGYGDLLSAYDGTSAKYYEPDALGSTDALADQSQAVVDRWGYRAFGSATQTAGTDVTPFTWVGRQGYFADSDTGLYLLGSGTRFYDPATAQFLSEDPVGLTSGDASRRWYVANNPSCLRDPSGLGPEQPPGGLGPIGGFPGPSSPGPNAWRYEVVSGPDYIDGKAVSYDIYLRFYFPQKRFWPQGATQFWQLNYRQVSKLGSNCLWVPATQTIIDIVDDIAKDTWVSDTLQLRDSTDQWCLYIEVVHKVHGFNKKGKEYEGGTFPRPTPDFISALARDMQGPKGELWTFYVYYNRKNCVKCCGTRGPIDITDFDSDVASSEVYIIPGLGAWKASIKE